MAASKAPPLVLHVIHHLVIGGMENGLVNLVNRMPAERFRHAIACIEDYSDFRHRVARPDVAVFALHRSRNGIWAVRRRLFDLCRELKPAIVHSRGMSGLDALLPAALAGVRGRVHGEHGWDVGDLDGSKRKPVLLRQLHSPLVHRYIAVSKHLEQYLRSKVRIAPSRITQIYNGVDTERFKRARQPRAAPPVGFAEPDSIVIGTVGRLQPVKDQATLVRAFAELSRRPDDVGRRVRLAIVGDGPLQREIHALVDALGLRGRTWMPGAVADVAAALNAIDVFVLPSLQEGISNTILEAMATSLPVVATAVGGNVELVEDERTGCLFAPRDAVGLERVLAAYCADEEMRVRHARAGRARAVETFSIERMVGAYQDVYERLCA